MNGEQDDIVYIDAGSENAVNDFSRAFCSFLGEKRQKYSETVILCIGTDRATGDSLGPITGYKLAPAAGDIDGVNVYGTLDEPVHAKNLSSTFRDIVEKHDNPLIIAVDACLGRHEHVGYLTIGNGPVRPGAGLNKSLPAVGHICITGIVNFSGVMEYAVLQNTRLNIVMRMADIIHEGILYGLRK